MLELRPNCECCDRDLPPDTTNALICTYECTFCTACNDVILKDRCPNCGGNLEPRADSTARKVIAGSGFD